MGGKDSGPKTRYDNGFHNTLRERVRESRAGRNELKTTISELVLFQLHNAKESLLKPVSIEPLPKFYGNITDALYRKYGATFTREDIENQVRACMGKSAEELTQQIGRIEKKLKSKAFNEMVDLFEKIFVERKKAEDLLETEFGTDKTRHFVEDAELEKEMAFREDVWLNSMEFLKSKGFNFYVSKLA